MARPEKVAVVDRVSEQMTDAAATLLTDYRGLTVTELAELRTELRKVNATYEVVKNTLTRRAAVQAGFEGLEEMLVGPTAIVFCGEDPVGPAKALKTFSKTHDALVIKGGYLDGAALSAAETLQLAELASREELLATMAGLMQGALSGFARLLNAPLAGMARAMGALAGDGGVEAKGFSPVAPAAPAEAPAEEETPAEDVPTEEAAAEDVVTDEAPAEEETPAEDVPTEEAAAEDVVTDEAVADDVVTDEAPEAVAEEAPEAAAEEEAPEAAATEEPATEDDAPADDADADA